MSKPTPALSERIVQLSSDVRDCRKCGDLAHGPRPIFQWGVGARIGIFAQAPGLRAHNAGRPFADPSGVRLRAWLGLDQATFYDASRVALIPMGFCFPGYDAKGGDLPPRPECAPLWRQPIMELLLPTLDLGLIIGRHALAWHMPSTRGRSLAEILSDERRSGAKPGQSDRPKLVPLPHPSWRNNGWLKRNPWFESEVLPGVRADVQAALVAPVSRPRSSG